MNRLMFFTVALIFVAVGASAATPSSAQDPGSVTPASGASGPPEAPVPPISMSGSLTFASRYLFQGIDYSAGKPVLNPEADLTWGPIGAKLWVNHDLDQRVSNEYDFSILHEWTLKKVSFTTGYTYLWYPHREGWIPSQELYVETSREGFLNPSLSVHCDFDAGTGTYSTLGLSHGFERKAGTVTVGTNLFYQDAYYGLTGFPSNEWNVKFEKTVSAITFTPSCSRFVTWKNGGFRDENAVRSAWLFSLTIARGL